MLKHHNKRLDEISVSRANFLLPFRSKDNWIWNGKVETKGGGGEKLFKQKELRKCRNVERLKMSRIKRNTRIFTFLPDFVRIERFTTSMDNFLI